MKNTELRSVRFTLLQMERLRQRGAESGKGWQTYLKEILDDVLEIRSEDSGGDTYSAPNLKEARRRLRGM